MLNPATTYYARVKAIGDSESEYSRTISVTTLPNNVTTPPTLPPSTPLLHKINTDVNYVSLLIGKTAPSEQVHEYKLTLSTVSDFSSTILNSYVYLESSLSYYLIDGVEYLAIPIANLINNTQYYIKITSSNSVGISSETISTFTTKTTLTAPELIGATSLSSINATVEWYSVSSAISYRIDVSESPTFSTLVINNATVSGTSYTVSALTQETTYYYRVRSYNGTITSNSSDSLSFSTLDGANTYAGIAINLGGVNGLSSLNVTADSFSLKWDTVKFADNYRIQISTSSNFSSSLTNTLQSSNSFIATGLTSGVIYYCRVRAENNYTVGSYVTSVVTTSTIDTNLISPALLSVSSRFSTGFIQNWTKRSYATRYIVDISTTNTFTSILQTFHTRDVDTLTLDGLTPNTTYYVRIRGANNTYISGYSTVLSVVTTTTLPTITPVVTVSSYDALVTWLSNILYESYSISVYKELGGSLIPLSPLYINRDIGNVSSFLIDLYIEPNTDYKVLITGKTNNGDSKISNPVSFITLNSAPYLQFDPISAVVNWKGSTNRLNASTSSEFVYTVPNYTDRVLDSTYSSISVRDELEKGSHLYIQGYFQGTSKGDVSNIIHTLNYHPVLLEPVIKSNSIEIKWLEGLSSNYRISIESIIGNVSTPLIGYLLPKDINNTTSHLITNLVSNTVYKINLYYQNEQGKFLLINAPLIYRTSLINSVSFPVVGTVNSPSAVISSIEFDRVKLTLQNTNSDIIGYSISQDDTSPRKIIYGETTSNVLELSKLTPLTTYFIKLWRIDSSNRSATQSLTGTTLDNLYSISAVLPTPSIQNVTILNISEAKVTWSAISNYKPVLEVSNSSSFSVLSSNIFITYYSNYAIVSGLLNTQIYSARLYTHDSKIISTYSSSVEIDTSI